ncbi:MAG: SRPBCC family protein [Rhodospirillales bacterium]
MPPIRTAAVAALLMASPALAHGPTRQKAEETVTIAAPPDKVWAVIANFHDMGWDPLVAATTGDGANTLQSFRTLKLKAGGELSDDLEEYDAAHFTYATFLPHNDPKVLPVTNLSTHLSVAPADGGKSVVTWRAAFYRGDPKGDPAPDMNDAAAVKAVHAFLRGGLDGLAAKFPGS